MISVSPTLLHELLRLLAQVRPGLDRGTQHVSSGQVAQAVLILDDGSLRALASTGRACTTRMTPKVVGMLQYVTVACLLLSRST